MDCDRESTPDLALLGYLDVSAAVIDVNTREPSTSLTFGQQLATRHIISKRLD